MDEAYRLKAVIEDAVRNSLGMAGLTTRDVEIYVDWDSSGVIMRRRRIGHEWPGDRGLGDTYPVKRAIRADMEPGRAASIAARYVAYALALREREATLERHHDDPDTLPAWAMLVERCALHLLRSASWRDEDILTFHRPQEGHFTVGGMGYTVGQNLPTGGNGSYEFRKPRLGVNAGVLGLDKLEILGPGDTRITYRGGRVSRIEMAAMNLPDTMIAAMRNRPLDQILGHPAISGCAARVTSAGRTRVTDPVPDLHLNLARDLVPMAPPPNGIETHWMETIRRG